MSGYNSGGPQDPGGEYGLTPQGSAGGYESAPGGYETPGTDPSGFGQPGGPTFLGPGQGQVSPGQPGFQQGYQPTGGYAGQAGPPQAHQGPPPYQQGPGPGGPPPYGMAPPPQKKSSTGLVLGIVGGVVALLLIAGVGGYFYVMNSRPDSMVKEYFEALAAGDADKALSYAANEPTDTTLLTDEVLKASNALGAITDVSITSRSEKTVRVSYRIGGQLDSVNYEVVKTDDGWKMREVAFPLGVTGTVKNVPLEINGARVKDAEDALVFPGTYELSTGSDYLAWSEPKQTVRGGTLQMPLTTTAELTDAGEKAARDAIRDLWDTCMDKKDLKPKGCPFQLAQLNGTVDKSSIRWSADPHPAKSWVIMPLRDATQLEGRTIYGLRLVFDYTNGGNSYHYDRTVTLSLNIYMDLTKEPLVVHWDN